VRRVLAIPAVAEIATGHALALTPAPVSPDSPREARVAGIGSIGPGLD
jgi:hypothetical protein